MELLRQVFPGDSEMAGRLRAMDWTKHPLGAPEAWPSALRTALGICLASRFPMHVWWGPDLTLFYNDAYITFLGAAKHPGVLARSGREAWAELWDEIGPMIGRVFGEGVASWSENIPMFFTRALPAEEVFVTFSFSPIFGQTGSVDGMFCACVENTEQVIGARRLETLRRLTGPTAERTLAEACDTVSAVLHDSLDDIPCAVLYLKDGGTLRSVARVRLAEDEAGFPALIEDGRFDKLEQPATLTVELAGRHWPEPVTQLIAIPIRSTPDTLNAVLVFGVGPRRPLDAGYQTFFNLLASQIGTTLAGVRAFEDERKRAEALVELDRVKTQFFSNISHEFRTPLTLMLGPIEQLLVSAEDEAQQAQLELVKRNAVRLRKLVNSLLDFSRIEGGRASMQYEPTELAGVTAEVAESFRSLFESAGLQLDIRCEPLDEPVYVDRRAWEHVVLNLLSNAYKFTFDGRIEVTVKQADGGIRLVVQDSGVGIDPAHLQVVFERFHRIEGVRARSYEGSGIGLALVRELVRLHRGTIAVTSEPGRGSAFTVTLQTGFAHLPAEQTHHRPETPGAPVDADAFVGEATSWPTERGVVRHGGSADRPRVLLVDDNRDMRAYVASLLEDVCVVDAVGDGTTALESARRNPPDLVLTDVMMPGLDGMALLRELRADPITSHIPVIILSARAGEEARIDGLDAGADDYIIKPFSARELRARIRTQLELSSTRVQIGAERAASRSKDDFLSLLGHELRNPLSALSTTIQTLMLKSPSPEIELMERSVWQLTRLVDDLLDISRLSRGTIKLQHAKAELAVVVDRALERVHGLLQERRTEVFTRVARSGLVSNCDVGRLAQVVANVVMNASKFSPPGSRVSIDAGRSGPNVRITVADVGAGISRERLSSVFEAFGDPQTNGGLGVGLAIARNLIELHGGTIQVRSAGVGHGTECTIEVPAEAVGAQAAETVLAVSRTRKRVLLVEDNDDTAAALKRGLEQLGYQVALAHNGPVALTVARSFQPDVALVDIGLPIMDGWELARRLREMRVPSRELHFVAVTARDQESDKQKSADAGFAEHLVKPIDLAKLERVVENLPDPVP